MKTTIKVDTTTRDQVRAVSVEQRATFDETIRLGLAALHREQTRARMRDESLAAAEDPADLAESRQVMAEMEAWSAR